MNNASVVRLDMRGQVWLEILNRNVGEAIGNDMTAEVILKQQNMPVLRSQSTVPVMKKLLVKHGSHPCLSVVPIIKSELFASFLIECAGTGCPPYNECRKFLASICISHKCISEPLFISFES